MRDLTLIMPFYKNGRMLQTQYDHLRSFPDDLKAHLRLIIVDDCSPKPAVRPDPPLGFGFAMYRILEDVRWNWIAARNLAVERANTRWVLMTDIDHMLPPETARRVICGKLNRRKAYRFSRVDAPDLTPYKLHPNTWLMTRKLFDQVGGYDERFSGFYGSDGEFRDRVIRTAGDPVLLPEVMVRVPREVVHDASVPQTIGGKPTRKTPADREGMRAARARIAEEGGAPHRLTFPWERVA